MRMSGIAAEPFQEFSLPSGGIILKSSDGVEFKVYKNILALSSPFFRQMFSLPQPIEAKDSESTEIEGSNHDDNIVSVSESSSTLDILLRLIYPITSPRFLGISESGDVSDAKALVDGIEPVLAAALKYEMDHVVKKLCEKLLVAAEMTLPDGRVTDDTLALRVFVLACRYHLKEEAHRAAHASLKGRVTDVFIDDLRQISAAQYFHLLRFRQNISGIVTSMLPMQNKVPPAIRINMQLLRCSSCTPKPLWFSEEHVECPPWWFNFVARACPVLLESPKSDLVFSTEFLQGSFSRASRCSGDCSQLLARWPVISQEIKEKIDQTICANDVDLSEI